MHFTFSSSFCGPVGTCKKFAGTAHPGMAAAAQCAVRLMPDSSRAATGLALLGRSTRTTQLECSGPGGVWRSSSTLTTGPRALPDSASGGTPNLNSLGGTARAGGSRPTPPGPGRGGRPLDGFVALAGPGTLQVRSRPAGGPRPGVTVEVPLTGKDGRTRSCQCARPPWRGPNFGNAERGLPGWTAE
jgi:hypothetical protein